MFSVMFEVHPRPGQVDGYLADAEMLTPELEQIDGFVDNVCYRSLTRGTADRARTAWPHRAPTTSRFAWRSPCFPPRAIERRAAGPSALPNLTYFDKVAKGGHFRSLRGARLFPAEFRAGLRSFRLGPDQMKCPRPFHHQRTFT